MAGKGSVSALQFMFALFLTVGVEMVVMAVIGTRVSLCRSQFLFVLGWTCINPRLFTYELARKLQGKGVAVNCLHPGAVRTNIWGHAGIATPLARLVSLFFRSPEKGAETIVYLASSTEVDGVTGKYFVDLKERHSSRVSYDEGLAARLWDLSARVTGLPQNPSTQSPQPFA